MNGMNLAISSCMIISCKTGLEGNTNEYTNMNDKQWNENHLTRSSMLLTVNFE